MILVNIKDSTIYKIILFCWSLIYQKITHGKGTVTSGVSAEGSLEIEVTKVAEGQDTRNLGSRLPIRMPERFDGPPPEINAEIRFSYNKRARKGARCVFVRVTRCPESESHKLNELVFK